MKSLTFIALALSLFSSSLALADRSISLNVDGENYTCSRGGASADCACKLVKGSYGSWGYEILYRGTPMESRLEFSSSAPAAVQECKKRILELNACK